MLSPSDSKQKFLKIVAYPIHLYPPVFLLDDWTDNALSSCIWNLRSHISNIALFLAITLPFLGPPTEACLVNLSLLKDDLLEAAVLEILEILGGRGTDCNDSSGLRREKRLSIRCLLPLITNSLLKD